MSTIGTDYTLSTADPMDDPYNPAIGFPQRKSDTLAALNQAWAKFVSG